MTRPVRTDANTKERCKSSLLLHPVIWNTDVDNGVYFSFQSFSKILVCLCIGFPDSSSSVIKQSSPQIDFSSWKMRVLITIKTRSHFYHLDISLIHFFPVGVTLYCQQRQKSPCEIVTVTSNKQCNLQNKATQQNCKKLQALLGQC